MVVDLTTSLVGREGVLACVGAALRRLLLMSPSVNNFVLTRAPPESRHLYGLSKLRGRQGLWLPRPRIRDRLKIRRTRKGVDLPDYFAM